MSNTQSAKDDQRSTGLRFNTGFEPDYGVRETAAPDVERIVCNNPSPFTFRGTGTFILRGGAGSKKAAVIDPGPVNEDHLAALLGALDGADITHVLVTHTHKDHSPLAAALKDATGARVVGCATWAPADPEGQARGLDASSDADYAPDSVMEDGDTIEVGSHTLTAVATPGHTANHLAFAMDGGILFPGDHVMGWSTTVVAPPDGHMRSYMQSLEKLGTRDETLYLPAHGAAIDQPHRYVRGLLTHRRQRETQIIKRLEAGDTRVGDMVSRLYPELDERLLFAAGLSVSAHMEDLIERGVVTSGAEAGTFRLV